jgi:ERF superfamily
MEGGSMNKSDSIAALAMALSKAQGQMGGAKKEVSNTFFKSKYADLASVWEAARLPLTNNGLAVIQLPGRDAQGHFVETVLTHSSGEWVSGIFYVTPLKDDPQGIMSATTYARRGALASILGIAPEDDDGEGAMGRPAQAVNRPASKPVKEGPSEEQQDKWINDHNAKVAASKVVQTKQDLRNMEIDNSDIPF